MNDQHNPAHPQGEPQYHSYLLRLWRNGPHDRWRATLQSTKTGERTAFADIDKLLAFLREQL